MIEGKDAKGRFLKGNKLGSGPYPKEARYFKDATKLEIMKCAHSLTKPWKTLEQEINNPEATRLEYITAQAVKRHNHRFIVWLCEMVVGRPKQTIDLDEDAKANAPFKIEFLDGRTEILGVGDKKKVKKK